MHHVHERLHSFAGVLCVLEHLLVCVTHCFIQKALQSSSTLLHISIGKWILHMQLVLPSLLPWKQSCFIGNSICLGVVKAGRRVAFDSVNFRCISVIFHCRNICLCNRICQSASPAFHSQIDSLFTSCISCHPVLQVIPGVSQAYMLPNSMLILSVYSLSLQLEGRVEELLRELKESRDRLTHQDHVAKAALQQVQKEMTFRLEQVKLEPMCWTSV